MKTIDTKSLLLGVLATSLVLTLTSSKSIENDNFDFLSHPSGFGIYNRETRTIYFYRPRTNGMQEKPENIYKLAADGSSATEMK